MINESNKNGGCFGVGISVKPGATNASNRCDMLSMRGFTNQQSIVEIISKKLVILNLSTMRFFILLIPTEDILEASRWLVDYLNI